MLVPEREAGTGFEIFFKIIGFLFIFKTTIPNQFWVFKFCCFYIMPFMVFQSFFQVFSRADIIIYTFLALQNVNVMHNFIVNNKITLILS